MFFFFQRLATEVPVYRSEAPPVTLVIVDDLSVAVVVVVPLLWVVCWQIFDELI